ncbi:MAG: hypothetical protein AAF702_40530 [Chloroflexota bacterium]
MTHTITLAFPHHDPEGLSLHQWQQFLPQIQRLVTHIVADVSPETHPDVVGLLRVHCTEMEQNERDWSPERIVLAGKFRRNLMALGLRTDSSFLMYCDGDRFLHWLEHYPDELAAVIKRIPEHDFTVLGRTERAFQTHPDVQYDTERIINKVFGRISGHAWDVTAAARGMSRAAAKLLVDESEDDTFGNDASWPLLIQQAGNFTMTEIKTEGLEFETAEKFADASAMAGGAVQWKARLDNDPRHWIHRLNIARVEVESMLPYDKDGNE